MAVDDFTPDIESSDGGLSSVESSREAQEKYREASKKAAAGIQKTQKDEKKAQKYDLLLAGFLVRIIVDKKYDFILSDLFKATDYGYTSNFVLGILSLINVEISNKIRSFAHKPFINFSYKSKETIEFNDNNLPKEVKDRINFWIEDIIDSTIIDYSEVQITRIYLTLQKDDGVIQNYISNILIYFLDDVNIRIKKKEALGISEFIALEVLKSVKKLFEEMKK